MKLSPPKKTIRASQIKNPIKLTGFVFFLKWLLNSNFCSAVSEIKYDDDGNDDDDDDDDDKEQGKQSKFVKPVV